MIHDLYQEVLIDHSRRPRNFRLLKDANRTAEGYNPLCGDRCIVFVKEKAGRIEEVGFQGAGCAISTSSASLMTEALKGKTVAEAEQLLQNFLAMVTQGRTDPAALGKLAAFAGVREFPVRVKCATLAWHTLQAALQNKSEVVTTE